MKVFSIFMLKVAVITVGVVFLKNFLRHYDVSATASLIILLAVSLIFYIPVWRGLSRELCKIEKEKRLE